MAAVPGSWPWRSRRLPAPRCWPAAPVRACAPFDLVVANILAEPLIGMAADLGEVVAPGGILILSGLLTGQEHDVLAAFRAAGFSHRFTMVLGEWSTLTVGRGIRT